MIEEFFKAHQYTIAAIAAAGTLAAVVTSLALAFLARRADRTRLKARADIVRIFDAPLDGKSGPTRFLKVRITNIGKFPLQIPSVFFYWKVPFKREFMEVPGLDFIGSPLIPPQHYPSVISPRASAHFTIWDADTFKQEVKRMRGANTLADRLRFHFIRAFVQTADGKTFRVKLSPGIRQVWTGRAR